MIAAKVRLIIKQPQRKAAEQAGVDKSYIAQASVVLQYAPDLVDAGALFTAVFQASRCCSGSRPARGAGLAFVGWLDVANWQQILNDLRRFN
jgi:hypothetical protein